MVDRHFDRSQDENRAKVSIFATEKEEVDRDSSGRRRKRGEFRRSHNSKQTQLGYENRIYRSNSYAGRRIAREYSIGERRRWKAYHFSLDNFAQIRSFHPLALYCLRRQKGSLSLCSRQDQFSFSVKKLLQREFGKKNLMKQVFFSVYATLDVKVTNWSQFSLPRCECSDQFW